MYYSSGTADIIACEQLMDVAAYAAVKRCSGGLVDNVCSLTHQTRALFCPKYHVGMKTFGLCVRMLRRTGD